jgi:hypothetical protein
MALKSASFRLYDWRAFQPYRSKSDNALATLLKKEAA